MKDHRGREWRSANLTARDCAIVAWLRVGLVKTFLVMHLVSSP
jgi:hypothetical protein